MKMTIVGRLAANATTRSTKTGDSVVNFTVVVNERYRAKGSDEVKEVVHYVNCAHWKAENMAKYLTKGKLVEVEGAIGCEAWQGKDGALKCALNLRAFRVNMLSTSKAEAKDVTEVPGTDIPAGQTLEDAPF